jgi:hypothetical protein
MGAVRAGNFLCGCNPVEKKGYSGEGKRYDEEGFEVCPEHGYRKYGWQTHMMATASGRDALDYGKLATGNTVNVTPDTVPDRRDNRDPAQVYATRERAKKKKAAGSNGKA